MQCSAPRTAVALGLNAFHLTIHSVTLDGEPISFQQLSYQWAALPADTQQANAAMLEAAYTSAIQDSSGEYLRFLQQEEQPDLILQVRDACDTPQLRAYTCGRA